jgi:hypothetical protein
MKRVAAIGNAMTGGLYNKGLLQKQALEIGVGWTFLSDVAATPRRTDKNVHPTKLHSLILQQPNKFGQHNHDQGKPE